MLSLFVTTVPTPKTEMMDVMGQSQAFFSLLCDTAAGNLVARILRGRLGTEEPSKEPEDSAVEEAIMDFQGTHGMKWF